METPTPLQGRIRRFVGRVRSFFETVPGSLQNHLNREELTRITVASLTAGGGMFGFFETLLQSVGLIFPSAADAALAGAVLTLIMEVRRRLSQGSEAPKSSRYRSSAG